MKAEVGEAKILPISWDPKVREPLKSLIKVMDDPDPIKITADEAVSRLRSIL